MRHLFTFKANKKKKAIKNIAATPKNIELYFVNNINFERNCPVHCILL